MNYRVLNVAALLALLVVVAPFVAQAYPSIVGADHAFVVQSGSMEPAIQTGSVVFVNAVPSSAVQDRISEGDVITYAEGGAAATTTHRVVEKHYNGQSVRFTTKGDANDDVDPESVYRDEVVGKVLFSIPLVGYVVAFGSTRLGWLVMVLLPVTLLIASELWTLYRALEPEESINE